MLISHRPWFINYMRKTLSFKIKRSGKFKPEINYNRAPLQLCIICCVNSCKTTMKCCSHPICTECNKTWIESNDQTKCMHCRAELNVVVSEEFVLDKGCGLSDFFDRYGIKYG